MASSARVPAASVQTGGVYSTSTSVNLGGLLRQRDIRLSTGDLHYIRNASQGGKRPQVAVEKEDRKRAGASEQPTRSSKRIEEKAKHLVEQEAAGVEFERLEALLKQRKREALAERAESLLLATTEEYRSLKSGLMRNDWLEALKEQETWKEHLKDLDRKREEHYRQILEDNNTTALKREQHEKVSLREKIQEMKRNHLQHLQQNTAKREREKAILAEEARQLKARTEQEKSKAAQEEQQRRIRHRQMHAEAMDWSATTAEEKLKNAAKLQDEAEAEAEFVTKRDEKLRLLEAQMRQMRQQQIELYLKLPAFQSVDNDAREKERLQKDVEESERLLALKEKTNKQNQAEQQRSIADERSRQQQMKIEACAKISREDAAFAKQWKEDNAQALLLETQKKAERRQACKETASIQQGQMEDLKARKRAKREEEKNDIKAALSIIEKTDEAVGALRLRCLQNALENGTNHSAIVNALSGNYALSGQKRHNEGRTRCCLDDSSEEDSW